jgi:hypothetical protein
VTYTVVGLGVGFLDSPLTPLPLFKELEGGRRERAQREPRKRNNNNYSDKEGSIN